MPEAVCPKCSAPAGRTKPGSAEADAGGRTLSELSGQSQSKGYAYACLYCGAQLPVWPEDPRLTAPPATPGGGSR